MPVVNQPARDDPHPRRTVNLPRDDNSPRTTRFGGQDQIERPPIPPPRNPPPEPLVNQGRTITDPDITWMSARAQRELPPLPKPSRAKTVVRNQLATSPISMPMQRESEAKPFFTQALTAEKNPQHRRLVTVVPLLLLVVILLFVFAYIAGR